MGRRAAFRLRAGADRGLAFQEEPWDVVAIGLMTDADNTGQKARCHYGDIAMSRQD